MKIVVTGGGSGGHITPILAVARELKQIDKSIEITYIGQTGDGLADVPAADPHIDAVRTIRAGKFRRYHGEGWRQLLDVATMAKNIRDAFLVLAGCWQSFWLLRGIKPDVVFTRGGFVSVPVAVGAVLNRIPYITHDSDAVPSLANRLIAGRAALHAVALPKEVYSYPQDKTVTVGVPIAHVYQPVGAAEQRVYREQLDLPDNAQMLLITGGGNGAKRLNDAVLDCASILLERYRRLYIVLLAGRQHEAELRQEYRKRLGKEADRVLVRGFVTNLHAYSGAADVVITRAGATAIAELAAQAKACILVPNPVLTGGHQLKNAQVLAERKAARLVSEAVLREDHQALLPAITELLDDPVRAQQLGKRLATLAEPAAAKRLAVVLLDIARK